MRLLLRATCVSLALTGAAAGADGVPRIVSPNATIDFGTVYEGQSDMRSFEIENQGDRDLVISRIHASCGCTVARLIVEETGEEIDPKRQPPGEPLLTLAPGKRANVEVTYNSLGQPKRRIVKYIDVHTNDPENARFRLTVTINVKVAFRIQPKPLKLGGVRFGTEASGTLRITPEPGLDFVVTKVDDLTEAGTELSTEELEDGRIQSVVTVTLKPGIPLGPFTRTLVLTTDHDSLTSIKVPIFADILPVVDIATDNPFNTKLLDFGVIAPGDTATKSITVTNTNPDNPIEVKQAVIDSKQGKFLAAEVVTIEEGVKYRVDVTVNKDLKAKFFKGRVLIRTNQQNQNDAVIYLTGWVKA